jgi:hypothetical protein
MSPAATAIQPPQLNGSLTAFVRDRADEWFACAQPHRSQVEVVGHDRRRVSVLYRLKVTANDHQHRLVAKQYWDWLGQKTSSPADEPHVPPRLFSRVDVDDKAPFEYAALSAIYKHFASLADRRFGAVRPLGLFAEQRTVVMEESGAQSLAGLVQQCHRLALSNSSRKLQQAMQNAGAWLRRFHELPSLPHSRARHTHREDFVHSIRGVVAFLHSTLGDRAIPLELTEIIASVAHAELPTRLPLGLSHTDFAPRNVLVEGNGSIAVIDTLGRWQAPVYEDLGHFLFSLRASEIQVYSQGCWLSETVLRDFEQAFLAGYFGESPFPETALRLFQLQALLYRWAALVHSARRPVGVRRLPMRCRLAAANHFLGRYLHKLLRDLPT